jgi:hypothetical protein
MRKRKEFDCVELQDRGALRIYEITKDMTFEEQVAYWAERSRLFREEVEAAKRAMAEREPVAG